MNASANSLEAKTESQINMRLLCTLALLLLLNSCNRNDVFAGYRSENFTFQGREARVIFPNETADHNFWIWRARFFGGEREVNKALLERGFHVAQVYVGGLYGNDEAVRVFDDFHAFVTKKYGLNQQVILEGASRGGLIIYNWGSRNPDKVACLFGDAPVCDIKSWPGGLYSGKGSPEEWRECLAAYGLDEQSVLTYEDIPVNNCLELARAGVPVMHIYGDADETVPHTENTDLVARKYARAGAEMVLIAKPGVGHHPHGLEDISPIVAFMLRHTLEKQ